jgi:hypothetical protein
MADNIRVVPSTSASDPNVATDEVLGQHYQKIKAGWGIDSVYMETDDTPTERFPVGGAALGLTNETAPASDTAASGLNGRLQRIAQRITSLMALLPASLGQKTMANSLAVTLASDQSLLPASLGQKTMANSFAVTLASDQGTVAVSSPTKPSALTTSSQVTATTTAATLLAANSARRSAVFRNIGANTVWIGKATVTTSTGIPLLPWDVYVDDDTTALWQCITSTSTSVVAITEA